jgi:hypothetical protein
MAESPAMSIIRFDEDRLKNELSLMSADRIAAFAVSCSERICHDARDVAGPEPARLLDKVCNALWAKLGSEIQPLVDFEQDLLDIMPDEEDDPTFDAAVVEDACAALIYAIRSFDDDAPQNAAWAARRVYETTDRFAASMIGGTEYTDLVEQVIRNHPVVQRELERQNRDVEILKNTPESDSILFARLKASAQNERVLHSG